jgi:hypothetical protein
VLRLLYVADLRRLQDRWLPAPALLSTDGNMSQCPSEGTLGVADGGSGPGGEAWEVLPHAGAWLHAARWRGVGGGSSALDGALLQEDWRGPRWPPLLQWRNENRRDLEPQAMCRGLERFMSHVRRSRKHGVRGGAASGAARGSRKHGVRCEALAPSAGSECYE